MPERERPMTDVGHQGARQPQVPDLGELLERNFFRMTPREVFGAMAAIDAERAKGQLVPTGPEDQR